MELLLSAVERCDADAEDLVDHLVRHGEAAFRRAAAVNEDVGAGPPKRLVEQVRVVEIERATVARAPVHLLAGDSVEALGALVVAFVELGAKHARPLADWIAGEQDEPVALSHPQFELALGLENAQENRVAEFHAGSVHPLLELGEVRRSGQRQLAARERLLALQPVVPPTQQLDLHRARRKGRQKDADGEPCQDRSFA